MTGPKQEKLAPLAVQGLVLGSLLLYSMSVTPYFFFEIRTYFAQFVALLSFAIVILFEHSFLKAQFMDPGVLYREIEYLDDQIKYFDPPEMEDQITQNSHIYRARYC